MIQYTEKGIGLHEAITAAGHTLCETDGLWVASDDVAVQAIIDAYDPVPVAQAARIAAINAECRARLLARYGPAEEQVSRAIGVYGPTEQAAMTAGIPATIDASNAASNAVLSAATVQAVEAVSVSWPAI